MEAELSLRTTRRRTTGAFVAVVIVGFLFGALFVGGTVNATNDPVHPRDGYTRDVSGKCDPDATYSKTVKLGRNEIWIVPPAPAGFTYTNIVFADGNVIYDIKNPVVGAEYHTSELYGPNPKVIRCIRPTTPPTTTAPTTTVAETTTTVAVTTPPTVPPTTPTTVQITETTAAPTTTLATPREEGDEPPTTPTTTTPAPTTTAPVFVPIPEPERCPTNPNEPVNSPLCQRLPDTGSNLSATLAAVGLGLALLGALAITASRRGQERGVRLT